jgi:iron complex outermembrane receptor protein
MIYRHKYLINKLCLLGTVSVLSVSVGSVSTAIAQSAASEAADAGQIMDPVTITATRRASSVQEVAASVTALDNAELQALNAVSLVDAAGAVPGAEIFDDRGAGQPTWVIRGVGLTDFNVNNAPTAAIYYDETYLVSNVLGGIGLFDLERVEVLKGPQGGLYGRNTTGGVVRVISAKPDLGRASGALRASYGSSDEVRIQGAANLPIIKDKLAIRLAGQAVQGGGLARQSGNFGRRSAWRPGLSGASRPGARRHIAANENGSQAGYRSGSVRDHAWARAWRL